MSNRPKTLKIDVTKIEKKHLFRANSGAVYLDIVMFRNDGKFGDDHVVIQSVSKEAREAGEKGPILGNATLDIDGQPPAAGPEPSGQAPLANHEDVDTGDGDDVPF